MTELQEAARGWRNFAMATEIAGQSREKAVKLTIDGRPIGAMARHLVTNADLLRFLNHLRISGLDIRWLANTANPNLPVRPAGPAGEFTCSPDWLDHPATGLTWYGAAIYADGVGGRLPTETEWMAAAGPGEYPWGDSPPDAGLANYGYHRGSTTPIGAFPAGVNGLFDLAGNVREWCGDAIPDAANRPLRVVKGGGWASPPADLRTSARAVKLPLMGSATSGLRIFYPE